MLPERYSYLAVQSGPRMLIEGRKLLGTVEAPGKGNNPVIMGWADEVGLKSQYSADAVPWCGLFMAVIAKRGGKELPVAPLWALNWSKFGQLAVVPSLGDVLVFVRNGGGHVALYVGEDPTAYHVLGGNQSDAVTITRIERGRLHAARRPFYSIKPTNVKPVMLSSAGAISQDEA